MHKRLFAGVMALVATCGVTSFVQADVITVTVGSSGFQPSDIVVRPGDTVQWSRLGGTHTATSGTGCVADGLFDGPLDGANPTFAWDVPDDASGVIDYFCTPHCASGMTGTILVDEGASVRFAGVAGSAIQIATSAKTHDNTNILDVSFDNGTSDRIQLGFEVEGAHAVVELAVVGTGHIEVRDLTSLTSTNYGAGDHEVVLGTGAHGFLGSGEIGSVSVQWTEPAGGGGSSPSGEGDLIFALLAGSSGISFWYTSSNDEETIWVGSTNSASSSTTLTIEVIDAEVERSLMYVGNVTASGMTLPAEGSDADTTIPVGPSTITVSNAGFFTLVLNDPDDDDGGGGSSCAADLTGDGLVNGADLSILLGAWGICP